MSSNAGGTATLLLLLQLGSRIVTFSLNQALLGFTTPAAFGTATIQLEPLLNTVLFLSREGIRSALVRTSSASSWSRNVLKISLIPLALGVPLSAAGFAFYRSKVSQSVNEQPFFATSVALYALATCLELASEPLFIRAQIANNVKLRVSIEGTAVVARAIVTLAVILYGRDRLALVAFGAGQVTYAAFLLLRYLWYFRNDVEREEDNSSSDETSGILSLSYALTKQSFVKQVLTEGDKVIVSRTSPIGDQGGYALALNYGSLVARIIFQPLEESSRLVYSRSLGHANASNTKTASPTRSNELTSCLALLKNLLKLQLYLSLIFTCFCPYYTTPLMYHLLGRSRWMNTKAPVLLSQYLYLLPFLGINGILEAFVQAVASEKQFGRMSRYLLVWSGIYCLTCYIGVSMAGMHEEALILANIVSMACRIVYSAIFIADYAHKGGQDASLWSVIYSIRGAATVSVFSAAVMRYSFATYDWTSIEGLARHIAIGVSCFLVFVAATFSAEREVLAPYLRRLSTRSTSKKTD